MPAMNGYSHFAFKALGTKKTVFFKGDGPGILLMHELPGMVEECVALADHIERQGFTVFLPLLFGKPLIAAVNGAAAGLGLVEALYCDIRFTTPEAKFTTAFARRCLIAEYGIAWILPRLVGPSRALDLLLSGRVLRGTEAHAIGLADHVAEPDALLDAAVDYATELATFCSPASMSTIKQQIRQAMESDFPTAVAEADQRMAEAFQHPDAVEGIHSYLEQRPPEFAPLDPE